VHRCWDCWHTSFSSPLPDIAQGRSVKVAEPSPPCFRWDMSPGATDRHDYALSGLDRHVRFHHDGSGVVCFARSWSQRVDPNSPRTRDLLPGGNASAFGRRRHVNLSVSKEISSGTLYVRGLVCAIRQGALSLALGLLRNLSLSLECLVGGDQLLFAVPRGSRSIHPSWRSRRTPAKSCSLQGRPPHQELFL